MSRRFVLAAVVFALFLCPAPAASAAEFNVRDYGATADDASDDTKAVAAALEACRKAGGGMVFVPAGTYLISRQGAESPILELPSDTTVRGEGAASVLKFHPKVNQSNFWRMLGAGKQDCRNVTIRDLRLDGSNTHQKYVPGQTPEHNHGLFFHRQGGRVENVTVRDCLIENFSGDCVGFSKGCRNVTIRDVTVRNFVRQGIQLAGGVGDGDYLVTGCQDLEHTVEPGGSTIHVEHAEGARNIQIIGNRCRRSILAGGVDGLVLRDNVVDGRVEGNGNKNLLVQGNLVRGGTGKRFLMQFGYAENAIVRDNIVLGGNDEPGGIYVWGASRYNPSPSRDVLVLDNRVRVAGRGVFLNGVRGGAVRGNLISTPEETGRVVLQRCEDVRVDRAE